MIQETIVEIVSGFVQHLEHKLGLWRRFKTERDVDNVKNMFDEINCIKLNN